MATFRAIEVTNAGGTYPIDAANPPDFVFLYTTGVVTLAANFSVAYNGTPAIGTCIKYIWGVSGNITLGAYTFEIEGQSFTEQELANPFNYILQYANPTAGTNVLFCPSLNLQEVISGDVLYDGSIPLAKLVNLTSGRIVVGSAGNIPTAVPMSGDATIVASGALTIANSAITNAKVDAAAAIARTKIANGTASHVVINDGSGTFSSEAQLATSRGGTGQNSSAATGIARVVAGTWSFLSAITAALGGTGIDTSGSTGFPSIAAGTWSAGALTDAREKYVSFATAGQGTYEMLFPFPCIVTSIDVEVAEDIAATDDATVTFQDETATALTGNNLTAGVLTVTASSNTGSNFATTVTANGVFTAGQKLKIITAKVTAGGTANVTVTYTRLTRS